MLVQAIELTLGTLGGVPKGAFTGSTEVRPW
jgi:hypothetical protein